MSFKSNIMEKFLQKSNSFNHYKKTNDSLLKENNELKENLKDKKEYVDDLKEKLNIDDTEFIFSIVMAVYNTEKYLEDAIDSVLNQSFPFANVQLILVDDGSVDGSANICKEYAEKYPENVVYIYQENQGQSSARNNGLKVAKGRYLNFLDSDDKLETNVLYDVYNLFNGNEEEIDVVSIPRYLFGRVNGPLVLTHRFDGNRIIDIENEYDFPQTSISASFIKREAFDFEFDKRIIISEDSVLINKIILKKAKFGIISTSRYMYRRNEDQNSSIDTRKTKKEYFNPRMKYYFKELIDYSIKKYGYVLKYIQYVLMYDLQWLFLQNTECGVLNKEESREFYDHIHDVLEYIDDDVILSQDFSNFLKYHILNFKHDKSNFEHELKGDLFLNYNGKEFDKLANNEVILTDLAKKDNALTLSGTFEFYSDVSFEAFYNNQKLSVDIKKTDEKYAIGSVYSRKYYFDIDVDLNEELNKVYFAISLDSQSYLLSISYDNVDITKLRGISFNEKDIVAEGKKTQDLDIYEEYRILELTEEISELEAKNKSLKQSNISLMNKNNHFKHSKFYKEWEKRADVVNFDKKDNSPKNLRDIKVALIADQFTYDSYKYEFTVIELSPDNWKQQFIHEKPDLFFCESAWDGYNFEGDYGPWHEKIFKDYRVNEENRTELLAILDYCKKNSIPTIFWNKEDPTSYKNNIRSFSDTASKFDYIFTSAKECVSQYKNDFNHKHVYPLMFAGQPKLFNPLKLSQEHIDGVVFAGSYYNDFPQRAKIMDDIFDRLIEKNVDLSIYDRNFYFDDRNYPKRYERYVHPPKNYDQTADLYKQCDWCLNFNTITKSETMFARRIFELALSYTNILTNYSKGIDEIFKGNVFVFDNTDLLPDFDKDYRDKRLNNLYNVLENHTYKRRWMEILDKIGFDYVDDTNDVCVIYKLNNEEEIGNIIDNFNSINHPQKDLRILALDDEINIRELKEKYPQISGIYRESEMNVLKRDIVCEYWILTDELIDSDFIKKAILHYQYLNKRLAIGYGEEIFKITPEKSIENRLFNRINLDFLTNHKEFDVYSIDKNEEDILKVSVIVPVYNAEEYLKECLDSIIYQTLEDIEIICIDDGSTDNSLKILKDYESKDSRIRVYSQDNQGPSGARNLGMSYAKAKYLYFVDADDYLDLEMLEKVYNISEEKDTDLIMFKEFKFDSETKEIFNTKPYDMPYLKRIVKDNVFNYRDIKDILFDIQMTVHGKFYKNEFISQFKFYDGIKFEDNLFVIETLIKAERMYFYDEYVYYKRVRDDSITATFYKYYKDFIIMNNELFEMIKNMGLFNEFKHPLYHKKLHNTYVQFHSIPYPECKHDYFNALKEDFLNCKDEYENDEVFLNEIDERDRRIFYNAIDSSTWQEFDLKMELFDKEQEINNINPIIEKNEKMIDELKKSNSKQKNEINSLNNKYNQILSSSSWKITKPLRKIKEIFKNNKKEDNSTATDSNKKNLLYVMHGGTGGTKNTNMDLMSYECRYYNCFLLVPNGSEMILYRYNDSDLVEIQKWQLSSKWVSENFYVEEYARIYEEILKRYSIDLVHIRQLIHHTFDLPKIAKEMGVHVVLSFHDFYLICLSHNLVTGEGKYCGGKCSKDVKCSSIMNLTNHEFINDFVDEWRSEVAKMLLNVDYFITTAQTVKDLFLEIYPSIPADRFEVIPHGRDFEPVKEVLYEKPSPVRPIKILFTGNINQSKGSTLIKELKDLDTDSRLELHFLGAAVGEVAGCGIHHGKYEREDLPRLIGEIKPSFIGIFSIWCETFCHTLTESWAYGIPVLCTDLGVQGERMSETDGGWFINQEDMQETYDMILEIAKDRKEYLSKIENVKKISFKSIEEMGKDYLKIYRKLLD